MAGAESRSCQLAGMVAGCKNIGMRSAPLDNSGWRETYVVVGSLRNVVDVKLEVGP